MPDFSGNPSYFW